MPLSDINRGARKQTAEQFLAAHTHPVFIHEDAQSQVDYEGTQTMGLHTIPTSVDPREARVWVVYPVKGHVRSPDSASLGRSEGNDIVISDPSISKKHAKLSGLTSQGSLMTVVDLESRNGTFRQDTRLTAQTPTVVSSGEIITFGRVPLRYLNPQDLYDYLATLRDQGKL